MLLVVVQTLASKDAGPAVHADALGIDAKVNSVHKRTTDDEKVIAHAREIPTVLLIGGIEGVVDVFLTVITIGVFVLDEPTTAAVAFGTLRHGRVAVVVFPTEP